MAGDSVNPQGFWAHPRPQMLLGFHARVSDGIVRILVFPGKFWQMSVQLTGNPTQILWNPMKSWCKPFTQPQVSWITLLIFSGSKCSSRRKISRVCQKTQRKLAFSSRSPCSEPGALRTEVTGPLGSGCKRVSIAMGSQDVPMESETPKKCTRFHWDPETRREASQLNGAFQLGIYCHVWFLEGMLHLHMYIYIYTYILS